MAKPYLVRLEQLHDAISPQISLPQDVQCKHFFSGAAAYVDGQIFMSMSPAGLALKLPAPDLAALFDQGAKPLQYFPKAPVKKDYAVLPVRLEQDKQFLGELITKSIYFARSK